MGKSEFLAFVRANDRGCVATEAGARVDFAALDATMFNHRNVPSKAERADPNRRLRDGDWYYSMIRMALCGLMAKTTGDDSIALIMLDRTRLVPDRKRAEEKARKRKRTSSGAAVVVVDAQAPKIIPALPIPGGPPLTEEVINYCCDDREGRVSLTEWAVCRFIDEIKDAHKADAAMPPPWLRAPVLCDDVAHSVHLVFSGMMTRTGIAHEGIDGIPEALSYEWLPPIVVSISRTHTTDEAGVCTNTWDVRVRLCRALYTNMGEADMVVFQTLRRVYGSQVMYARLKAWLRGDDPAKENKAPIPDHARILIYMTDTDVVITALWLQTLRGRASHTYMDAHAPPPFLSRYETRVARDDACDAYWEDDGKNLYELGALPDTDMWELHDDRNIHLNIRVCMDTTPRILVQYGNTYDINDIYRFLVSKSKCAHTPDSAREEVASIMAVLWVLGASDYTDGLHGVGIKTGLDVWFSVRHIVGALVEYKEVSPQLSITTGWQLTTAAIMRYMWCLENKPIIYGAVGGLTRSIINSGMCARLECKDGEDKYASASYGTQWVVSYNNASVACRDLFTRVSTNPNAHARAVARARLV